jgi:hypothetical protein
MKRVLSGALLILGALSAQPTCNQCSATYVAASEMEAYKQRAIANHIIDQQVRAVDIGRAHVGIGMVYRGKLDKPQNASVAEHDQVSEVYHIIDGSATLVTGWDIQGAKPRPPDNEAVRLLNGPGNNAETIRNGATYNLKPGDVIVIPAGVGHWYTKIDDHITYMMVRIDPDKVVPLKDEAASKADLAKSGR